LAVELKSQLEELSDSEIIELPRLDHSRQWIKLLQYTKPFENQLSMSPKLICLIISQRCIEAQLKQIVIRQT